CHPAVADRWASVETSASETTPRLRSAEGVRGIHVVFVSVAAMAAMAAVTASEAISQRLRGAAALASVWGVVLRSGSPGRRCCAAVATPLPEARKAFAL